MQTSHLSKEELDIFKFAKEGDVIKTAVTCCKLKSVDCKLSNGFTPLMVAMQFKKDNYLAVINYLIGLGADPHCRSASGLSALDIAKINQDNQAIELLEKWIKHREKQINELLKAAKEGDYEHAFQLTEHEKVDLNCTNVFGQTPLMLAAYFQKHRYLEIMQLLITKGASLDARTRLGKSVLDIAKARKDKEAIQLLESAMGIQTPVSTLTSETDYMAFLDQPSEPLFEIKPLYTPVFSLPTIAQKRIEFRPLSFSCEGEPEPSFRFEDFFS